MSYEIATVLSNGVTELQCCDPRKALRLLQTSSGPVSQAFLKRANSYRCPVGRDWGQGWTLLYGSQVKELNGTATYSFRMSIRETRGKLYEEISLQDAYVLRAICISDGYGEGYSPSEIRTEPRFFSPSVSDDNSLYLVEFVDQRYYLAKFSSINKQYNVRNPATQKEDREDKRNFYRDTLRYPGEPTDAEDDGEPWSWSQMLNDIWDELPSFAGELTINLESGTGGDYPTEIPENYYFNGVTTWEAFHHVLDHIGATLVFNPETTSYRVESNARRQSKLATSNQIPTTESVTRDTSSPIRNSVRTVKELDGRRVFDYEVNQYSTALLPQKFKVHFKRQEQYYGTEPDIDIQRGESKAWLPNAVHVEEVTTTEVTLASGREADPWPEITVVSGTEEPVWHPAPAFIGPDGELHDNTLSEATRRTHLLALAYVKSIILDRLGDACGRVIYSGLPDIVRPGVELKAVVWRDYGDKLGLVTEAHSSPGPMATPSAVTDWQWSAMLGGLDVTKGLRADQGLARIPSRENTQPTNFGQHGYPVYPQPMQFVMVVSAVHEEEPGETETDYTPVADCGLGKVAIFGTTDDTDHSLPGVVVRLEPSRSVTNSGEWKWNPASSEKLNRPGCRIVIPGLRKQPLLNDDNFAGLLGQVFLAKLAGATPEGIPIFVADFRQDFMVGDLVDELNNSSTLATCTGIDGNTYEVSGMFIEGSKVLPAGTRVGFHALPFMETPAAGLAPYWVVIAANACPQDPA